MIHSDISDSQAVLLWEIKKKKKEKETDSSYNTYSIWDGYSKIDKTV